MTRREERRNIFSLVYASLISEIPIDELIDNTKQIGSIEINRYVEKRVKEIVSKRNELNKIIEIYLRGFTIDRITKVSQSILNLAIYEIKYDDTIDEKVSVNEAVELAKEYSKEDDYAFVNGVLSNYIKSKQ